jgi:Uma2 family endonuclease
MAIAVCLLRSAAMTRLARTRQIYYPESDGRPMGETDLHRWWMIHIYDLLQQRYKNEQVYVSSNLLLYYVEGDPKKFVVPDDFVVLDCAPGRRRTFQVWAEQRVPNVVIEVTSRETKRQDQVIKPAVYAQIGVKELFLYDPTLDYLTTPLQGYRLDQGEYVPIAGNRCGGLDCLELGISLSLDRERLVMSDTATGDRLLTEAEYAGAKLERARAAAVAARLEAAELRARLAEVENQRLREQLAQRDEKQG